MNKIKINTIYDLLLKIIIKISGADIKLSTSILLDILNQILVKKNSNHNFNIGNQIKTACVIEIRRFIHYNDYF